METALWIVQVLLAAIFLVTGTTKLTQPRLKMAAGPMRWAAEVTDAQFRMIGLLEILGAIGIILPAALGIAPLLTSLAAVGLVLVMVGAIYTHVRYDESERLAVPIVVLALAVFVALEGFGTYIA
ncbi:MAG: DoxX family protein [Actinomycetota bacterium]|nr:DoxX family protein [Actinomycetota bacterium]